MMAVRIQAVRAAAGVVKCFTAETGANIALTTTIVVNVLCLEVDKAKTENADRYRRFGGIIEPA